MANTVKITNNGDVYQFYDKLMEVFQNPISNGDITTVRITLNSGDFEIYYPQSIACNSNIDLPENLTINRGYISYTDDILREIYRESLEEIHEVKVWFNTYYVQ